MLGDGMLAGGKDNGREFGSFNTPISYAHTGYDPYFSGLEVMRVAASSWRRNHHRFNALGAAVRQRSSKRRPRLVGATSFLHCKKPAHGGLFRARTLCGGGPAPSRFAIGIVVINPS